MQQVSGQLIDLFQRRTYPAVITIENEIITDITETITAPDHYILPGFVDAHIHVESSMLVPTAFAKLAVVHGTVATVSDPHDIANVCGIDGVQYMIDNSKQSPFKFFFGAPSCVPATAFETAGGNLDVSDVATLLQNPDIWYLSEMMNYLGVLHQDPEVMAKIAAAHAAGKPVDGHAPGLRGAEAAAYAAAGITTDHECFTLAEAIDKINAGMHILIREGSAAKNFDALAALIKLHPNKVMFCSDDKHPDELELNHINALVIRALAMGFDIYDVLRATSVNPVMHYRLPVGLLQKGDYADFIIIDNTLNFNILQTVINGIVVAENGNSLLPSIPATTINNFNTNKKTAEQFKIPAPAPQCTIRVIEAIEGQLVTNQLQLPAKVEDGMIISDVQRDILKIAVVNRYQPDGSIAIGFIKNIGIKKGALASTVGHDCHNIIVVGADDESMCAAVNTLIDCKGGIAVTVPDAGTEYMALPVAGLMSAEDGHIVAAQYTYIDKKVKELGTPLKAPFMTLSFMALLVIPSLKLSDKGLFDGSTFHFTPLCVQ